VLSNKRVRSQGEGVVQCGHFADKRGFFKCKWCIRCFLVQQLYQTYGVSARTGKGGLASANILKTKGEEINFSRFYADVFYEWPKSQYKKVILHFLSFVSIFLKSNLRYTRLRKAHTIKVATVASRWQRVGDLIGSGFERHTPAPEANVSPLLLII